ncbi:hypothetical protein [Niveibacterium terrae]|uniref:hypothetical protein n=1 Tax=Niveibacterium terrae TaxID=3373598 RepID=UPI003A92CCE8
MSVVLKWGALLITIGGLVLHVAGYCFHTAYDKAWGLDATLFPKSIEWVQINGYYVALNSLVDLYNGLLHAWWKLAQWGAAIAVFSYIGVLLILHGKENLPRDLLRRGSRKLPKWLLALLLTTGYSASVCLLVLAAPIVFAVVLVLPASQGEALGKKIATVQIALYQSGCADKVPDRRCTTFHSEGPSDLRGFLIDSSETQLAIFIPETKQIQVIGREKVEIEMEVEHSPDSK